MKRHNLGAQQRRRRRSRAAAIAGASLVELLVAMGVSGIVIATAGAILLQGFSDEGEYRVQSIAQQNARMATDTLGDDLRGSVAGSLTIGALTYTSPLSCPIYYDDGTPRNVFWWLSGGVLYRKVALTTVTGPANATDGIEIASGISALTVTMTTNSATLAVTATFGTAPSISTVTVNSTVGLRNILVTT